MKAVVAAFNKEKALVRAFFVIMNHCVDLRLKLFPKASASVAGDVMNRFSESSKLLFQFSGLRDLEIQYMDDSRMFLQCVQDSASRLTRLCLNKMISISFETLAAIKQHCRQLEVLDVYVDQV